MRLLPNDQLSNTTENAWMKRLAWASPLFFLVKGLLWLSLPVVLAFYGLN